MTPVRRALSLLALAAVCSLLFGTALAQGTGAAKPNTDYRIYKIYQRYVEAAGHRARSAANYRINSLVLRYGNKNWGLDHLEKHGWGTSLDNAIQYLVSDPKTSVRPEGGGSYRWQDKQIINDQLCPFRVIENRNELSDHYEKGIITAYPLPPCGEVFVLAADRE
jgi:hypothetical protein